MAYLPFEKEMDSGDDLNAYDVEALSHASGIASMMNIYRSQTKLISIIFGFMFSNLLAAGEIQTAPMSIKAVQREKIRLAAPLVKGVMFHDVNGEHLLLLTQRANPSKSKPDLNRMERHELKATHFKRSAKGWIQEWAINDYVDCPGLDSEANFYLDKVSITDVNNDGHAEVSVPYNLFCGGGVDSKTIKIIMRTKNEKFALRGKSKIVLPGQESFGGEMEMDPLLNKDKNVAYRDHLIQIWNDIWVEKY